MFEALHCNLFAQHDHSYKHLRPSTTMYFCLIATISLDTNIIAQQFIRIHPSIYLSIISKGCIVSKLPTIPNPAQNHAPINTNRAKLLPCNRNDEI
jgi:hypothetical protein